MRICVFHKTYRFLLEWCKIELKKLLQNEDDKKIQFKKKDTINGYVYVKENSFKKLSMAYNIG